VTEKEHQSNLKQIARSIEESNAFLLNLSQGHPTHKCGSATSKKSFEGDITLTQKTTPAFPSRGHHSAVRTSHA